MTTSASVNTNKSSFDFLNFDSLVSQPIQDADLIKQLALYPRIEGNLDTEADSCSGTCHSLDFK